MLERDYHVGLEWTNEVPEEAIIENFDKLSCFELIPENFFDNRRMNFLEKLKASGLPVLIHSVEVSFGTMEPLKQEHLDRVKEVASRVNVANFSDHLSMTEAGGVEIGQLTPIPWTNECLDAVCRNIEAIQKQINAPFLIENITNRFELPNSELKETEFINKILERTGCGLLIDLNNVHTNGVNFGYDPREWIDSINLSKVQGVHLAGGYLDEDGDLVDSHSRPCPDAVWDLYKFLCDRIIPPYSIVEWTADAPKDYAVLLAEVEKAKAIIDAAYEKRYPKTKSRNSYQPSLAVGAL